MKRRFCSIFYFGLDCRLIEYNLSTFYNIIHIFEDKCLLFLQFSHVYIYSRVTIHKLTRNLRLKMNKLFLAHLLWNVSHESKKFVVIVHSPYFPLLFVS